MIDELKQDIGLGFVMCVICCFVILEKTCSLSIKANDRSLQNRHSLLIKKQNLGSFLRVNCKIVTRNVGANNTSRPAQNNVRYCKLVY